MTPDQRQLIEQVGRPQRDAIEQVLDAPEVRGAQPPDDADDLVPFVEQQLGEVRPVLTGDSGDASALCHVCRWIAARGSQTDRNARGRLSMLPRGPAPARPR